MRENVSLSQELFKELEQFFHLLNKQHLWVGNYKKLKNINKKWQKKC